MRPRIHNDPSFTPSFPGVEVRRDKSLSLRTPSNECLRSSPSPSFRQRRQQTSIVHGVSLAALSLVAINCLISSGIVSGPTAFRESSDAWLNWHRKTSAISTWMPAKERITNHNETYADFAIIETAATRILNMHRQNHTRPPEATLTSLDNSLPTGSLLGPQATGFPVSTSHYNDSDWSMLCRKAGLNETSRVAVAGILSQPPGVPMALFLAKHCHVRHVLGVDSLFPNHKDTRMEQMQEYRNLIRYIDDIDLLLPPFGLDLADHEVVIQRITDFRPTHVISIKTNPLSLQSIMKDRDARYYEIKNSLVSVHTILSARRKMSASGLVQPTFLQVTSSAYKDTVWARLSSIFLRSNVDINVIHLQLPKLYGPMVAPWKDVRHLSPPRRMYVDDAVASILLALTRSAKQNNSTIHQASYTLVETYSSAKMTGSEGALVATYQNETQAWLDNTARPLGTSMNPGKYLDFYGLARTRFPCASTCKSLQCMPTMFDPILHVTRKVTKGCSAVLYMANFSSALQDLPTQDNATDMSSSGDNICRVAFVSGNSRLVASVLTQRRRQQSGEAWKTRVSDRDILAQTNGLRIDYWKVVWIDRDETSVTDLDAALLRLEPSGFFSGDVDRALYTESINMMQAHNQRLERLFKKIWLSYTPAKKVKQYDEESQVWRWIKIDKQKHRRAILFTREPDEETDYKSFIANAGSAVQSKQKRFYEQASEIVLSREGRVKTAVRQDGQSESFPYQWITPAFILHELSMRFSQDFRCDWMQEYLFWGGGGRDSAMLSFAYILGKQIVGGSYSPRLEFDHDGSWFASLNKEKKIRSENRRTEEVFIRILPHDGASE